MMKIAVEESVLNAADFFAGWGEFTWFQGATVKAADIADAELLLVRSTTEVTADLLQHCSQLRMVGTATAGTNHLDYSAIEALGAKVTSAAGCNAIAVAEYVLSALLQLCLAQERELTGLSIGIVGAGHVGSRLAAYCRALGMQVVLCDPPLQDAGDSRALSDMDAVMACDIISLHVPLITDGPYPTLHMFDRERLTQLRDSQILVNACRGEVVDNSALLELKLQGAGFSTVFDVWENEPSIHLPLIPHIDIATAHIAGHSIDGKIRGTEMLYQAACELWRKPVEKQLEDFLPTSAFCHYDWGDVEVSGQSLWPLVQQVYNAKVDSELFKSQMKGPENFRQMRKNYAIRREFSSVQVSTGNCPQSQALYDLGFRAK